MTTDNALALLAEAKDKLQHERSCRYGHDMGTETCDCGIDDLMERITALLDSGIKDAGDDVVEPSTVGFIRARAENGNKEDASVAEFIDTLLSAYKRVCVERDAFKQYWLAVDHRMVVLHLGTADSFDADTCMNKILEWETTIALDPQVSRPAQELKDTYLQRAEKAESEREQFRKALDEIATWPHSGTNEYRKGENDPRGYYACAYDLMEAEISKARDIARTALAIDSARNK